MASRNKDLLSQSLKGRTSSQFRSTRVVRSQFLSRSVGEEDEDDNFDGDSIMDLKKQLALTKHELNMSKLTRSISTSGHCNGDLSHVGPGSPYRTSSGSLNGLGSRPSLNKELMQKLRSMTETIKMLSQENSSLRTENEELRDDMLVDNTPTPSMPPDNHVPQSSEIIAPKMDSQKNNDYDDLSKPQLISLILSYDAKVKALTTEVAELARCRDEVHTKSAEKDKYKALARRLKEERNQYKESLDDKLNEQSELKDEMEKMSELIGDLRENCQQLRDELLLCRSNSQSKDYPSEFISVGTQVRFPEQKSRASSLSNMKKGSAPSLESVRRAKAVYGPAKATASSAGKTRSSVSNSTSSSIVSLRDDPKQKPSPRGSPIKKPQMSGVRSPAHGVRGTPSKSGGPRIAKPVVKPSPVQMSSPSKKPLSSRSSSPLTPPKSITSNTSSGKPSPLHQGSSPARISRIPQPSPSRIPSATRYQSPSHIRQLTQHHSRAELTPSPPPPPPPSQIPEHEEATPSPPKTPVEPHSGPGPYPSTACFTNDDIEDELDSSVLRIEADGKIQMEIKSSDNSLRSRSPVLPKGQDKGDSHAGEGSSSNESNADENDEPSADDEGSRDGDHTEDKDLGGVDTPRTSRRRSEGGSLAARRVQRTWKHFYEEECHPEAETLVPESELLEERREQNPDLSLSKLAETTLSSHQGQTEESMKSLITTSSPRDLDRKYSLPSNINESVRANDDLDDAINGIECAIQGHQNRSKSLSTIKQGLKIHIARPWLKKKPAVVEESSEEEIDRVCGSIQSVIRAHDRRQKILQRLEADKDMFVSGKVDALKAKFNERRAKTAAERSDGVTDDDEDVVY
ncbi:uncharacterized protein DDB_G0284459-like isoform X3 [Tigriopus californicus]|uniref:uncharacterized protein DDB_G0284459-like isoform X3 n=1 Tax=Tigriopus californicus TaxID=6832 RepID=UPI0027D9FAC5|nr:uncharacterized protein DDB_G0284459-like isoform X3 [Tigriopus californicus]